MAGVRIASASLYEMIDAHGHDVDPAGIPCGTCRDALAGDGWCEASEIGYVAGRAYVSELAYLLARGDPVDPASLDCRRCRAHVEEPGWCDSCCRGMIGGRAYRDRALYDRALIERERLVAASVHLARCELCAVVAFAGGRCPKCHITYRGGRAVPSPGTR